MMNKIFFSIVVLYMILTFFGMDVQAARKPLRIPAPVDFNAEKFLHKGYKEKLDKLKGMAKDKKAEALEKKISELYRTTIKQSARDIIKELRPKIKGYEKKDPEFVKLLEEISEEVESRRFNKERVGIEFEVDEENREYILSWDDGTNFVMKRTPFPPKMVVEVEAEYVPGKSEFGGGMNVYRYWASNGKGSKAPFYQIYLENKFPKDGLAERIEKKYGRMVSDHPISSEAIIRVTYPMLRLFYFKIRIFNPKTELMLQIHPGEKIIFPYELEAIDGSLPGIIMGYVPIHEGYFHPHMVVDPESSPEIAVEALMGRDENRTLFMHRGKTIGPVPAPKTFSRDSFIDTIISYGEQSIDEGWVETPAAMKFTREGLAAIKSNPANKAQINDFLAKLEKMKKNGQILSEAYALLRYNLEYLLGKL